MFINIQNRPLAHLKPFGAGVHRVNGIGSGSGLVRLPVGVTAIRVAVPFPELFPGFDRRSSRREDQPLPLG